MEFRLIPKFILTTLGIDVNNQLHVNVLFTSVLLVLVPLTIPSLIETITFIPHICLSKSVLGVDCPGCGITRSFRAIFMMNFQHSWTLNPLAPPIFLFLLLQIPLRSIALSFPDTRIFISLISKRLSETLAVSIILYWMMNFR